MREVERNREEDDGDRQAQLCRVCRKLARQWDYCPRCGDTVCSSCYQSERCCRQRLAATAKPAN